MSVPVPLVSVVLSVYNNVRTVGSAVASVLEQRWSDFELIAIDDGSTDGSGELLDRLARGEPRLRVVHQGNRGLGPALHRGCELARGELIARQDADDVSGPERLGLQVAYLRSHPAVVLCGTWSWFIDSRDGPQYVLEPPDDPGILRALLEAGSNPFVHGSVMFRRTAYAREPDGYRFRGVVEDLDLWLRLSRHGPLGMLTSVQYFYRISATGINLSTLALQGGLMDLALRLHRERNAYGVEREDWLAAEGTALKRANHSAVDGEAAAEYTRALAKLLQGDRAAYRLAIAAAARGTGPAAARARLHQQVGGSLTWPLLRALYARRFRQGAHRYRRWLAPGTPLPAFASALTHDGA